MKHKPYKGLIMAQNDQIDKAFKILKKTYWPPSKIIELGTAHGGFAIWLKDLFKCEVYTFDKAEWGQDEEKKLRRKLYIENRIHYEFLDVMHEQDRYNIIDMLDSRTILLCDNGVKETEFEIYGKHIKPGGLIMVHDHAKNREYFNKHIKGIYWNSLEFEGDKFEEYCKQHNLKPYLQEEFEKAVWFIRIKDGISDS